MSSLSSFLMPLSFSFNILKRSYIIRSYVTNLLFFSPQRKALCIKVLTISPKKPNSANRRVAIVKLSFCKKLLTVKIPGEKHNLQQHSTILVSGSSSRDLVGVNLKAIRGKYDLTGVKNRRSSRSLYGVKRIN